MSFQNGTKVLTIFKLGDAKLGIVPSAADLDNFRELLRRSLNDGSPIISGPFLRVERIEIPQFGEIKVEIVSFGTPATEELPF